MREGVAEDVVAPALRHAELDTPRVVVVRAGLRAAESGNVCALGKEHAEPDLRQTRIGEGNGTVGKARLAAPYGGDGVFRRLGNLDLGAQLVEAEPFRELGGLVLRAQ